MKILGRFRRRALTDRCTRETRSRYTIGKVRETSSNGVMEEDSGKVQKLSAHAAISFIVMDLAIVESQVAAIGGKTPALQK